MQFESMRKRTVFNYLNGHLGSENLLDQNSLLLLRHIPNKATDENVNIERVRKYFTKQGWKALKALIIEKNDNLIWDCKLCEIDLHVKESIFCDYCLVWFHLKCTNLKKTSQNQPIGVVGNASKCKIHLWSFVNLCFNSFLHYIVFIFQIFYQNLKFILLKSSSILNDF
jgi:hypothetical protein